MKFGRHLFREIKPTRGFGDLRIGRLRRAWLEENVDQLSEGLLSFGIMGGKFRVLLKPLYIIVLDCLIGFKGALNRASMMPNDASLSRNCTFDRCSFFYRCSLMEKQCLLCAGTSSPPNSNTGGSYHTFSVPFFYFLFIFYLSRCTLPDFSSVSSAASLPFSPCCHRTTTTEQVSILFPTVVREADACRHTGGTFGGLFMSLGTILPWCASFKGPFMSLGTV